MRSLAAASALATIGPVLADALPFLPPGDARLRHLVQIEADEGRVALTTTWPIASADLPNDERSTLYSLQQPGTSNDAGWFLSGAAKPTEIRTFDDTPREKGALGVQAGWAAGDYAGGVIRMSYALQPQDEKHYRFDDTYVSWRLGNWWFTAGEQQRWWGPGWDGSLIFSNNARPMPSLSLDRASSTPFESRWLRWIGPWHFTTFMGLEERQSDLWSHPLVLGMRATARPFKSLELGLSRTDQWCRKGACGLHTLGKVLLGKNNVGANVTATDNPGNGELSIDLRWRLPALPAAIYWQENGETADGKTPLLPRPRQTMQLLGFEVWSRQKEVGSWRVFTEWAGTTCGEFSFSQSDQPFFNCAYNNATVTWGYYYRGRVLGHAIQGDSQIGTIGGLYLDGVQRTWEFRLRKGTLNRDGQSVLNTLAPVRTGLWDVEAKVDGHWKAFTYSLGVGADRLSPDGGTKRTSARGFLTVAQSW